MTAISGLTAADVRAVTFRTVRLEEGYDPRPVDEFLEALATDLESPAPTLGAQAVIDVRFPVVRVRQGYLMSDVDTFCDELVDLLTAAGRPALADRAPRAGSRLGLVVVPVAVLLLVLMVAVVLFR